MRMRISSSAVSLTVDDAAASSQFLQEHFGFEEEMAADGFASLARDDAGMNVIFLRRGLSTLPEDQRLAVALCDLHGFDYAAIADMTSAELGTVKSRINRGRRRLRDHLLAHRELLPSAYRLREE